MADTMLLWVYGTLKEGGRLHAAMRGATLVARCRTAPGYRLLNLGSFPGLVRVPRPREVDTVAGELFEVPVKMLDRLDEVEGAPTLFCREPIRLTDMDRQPQAFFYKGPVEGREALPGGEWPV